MEVKESGRNEFWITEMVGRLPDKQRNEDSIQGQDIRLVLYDKWSPTGGSFGSSYVCYIYINNMVDVVISYVSLFADDGKLLKGVRNESDCEALPRDLDKIWDSRKKIANGV